MNKYVNKLAVTTHYDITTIAVQFNGMKPRQELEFT